MTDYKFEELINNTIQKSLEKHMEENGDGIFPDRHEELMEILDECVLEGVNQNHIDRVKEIRSNL